MALAAIPRESSRITSGAMSRPVTAACAIGALSLAFASPSIGSVWGFCALALGVWGVAQSTSKRGLLGVIAVLALASFVANVPEMIPSFIRDSPDGAYEYADPLQRWTGLFARTLETVALVATLVAARRRAGGIAILAAIPLILGVGAKLVATVIPEGPPSIATSVDAIATATGAGLGSIGYALVAVTWLVCGLAPIALPKSGGRALLVVGAVGTTLLAAALAAADHLSERPSADLIGLLITANVGWLLIAIGSFGGDSAGGRAGAIIGTVLIGLGLLACPLAFAAPLDDLGPRVSQALFSPWIFGFAGLAVIAATSLRKPLRPLRLAAAVLMLVAVASMFVGAIALVLATSRDLSLPIREPFWAVRRVTLPAAELGLVLLTALQALLGAPPSEPLEPSPEANAATA